MSASERLRYLLDQAADLMVMSLFLVACTIFFLPGIQKRWSYAAAAFAFGAGFGLAARQIAIVPDGVEILAVMLGVVTGPVTAARLQGKTIFEAIKEIRDARRGGKEK